jgi:hypothetical protein
MVDGADAEITVEVAYALPDVQKIIALKVPRGSSAFAAAELSGITQVFPELDLQHADMGVFGKVIKPRDYVLQEGDRVEIYRALQADPKEVRKKRAQAAKGG